MSSDAAAPAAAMPAPKSSLLAASSDVAKRQKAETRFRAYGLTAICIGLLMLVYLVYTVVGSGYNAFFQTRITVEIPLLQEEIDKAEKGLLKTKAYRDIITKGLKEKLAEVGIETEMDDKELVGIISGRAPAELRSYVRANPDEIGSTVSFDFLAQSFVDGYFKGRVTRDIAERSKSISVAQLDLMDELSETGVARKGFNLAFITGNAQLSPAPTEQVSTSVPSVQSSQSRDSTPRTPLDAVFP